MMKGLELGPGREKEPCTQKPKISCTSEGTPTPISPSMTTPQAVHRRRSQLVLPVSTSAFSTLPPRFSGSWLSRSVLVLVPACSAACCAICATVSAPSNSLLDAAVRSVRRSEVKGGGDVRGCLFQRALAACARVSAADHRGRAGDARSWFR